MVKPVHAFSHKVLPLTYDDSLSYYEVLCKLTNKVNEMTDVINSDFESIIEEKVDKYFNQIMIDASYVAQTETLVLSKQVISAGDYHVYNSENNAIEIV